MKTQIFHQETLDKAATLLKEGEVVAFPTETVYGLGAIATSQEAVLKVFEAKGRPSDNPLIVHVHSVDQVMDTVEEFPESAKLLAKHFWPGPLTMILKAKPGIYALALSAGLPTVSFRMPNHELTLSLIEQVGIPLVQINRQNQVQQESNMWWKIWTEELLVLWMVEIQVSVLNLQ